MQKIEFMFYEWLIVNKGITNDDFLNLTQEEFKILKLEFVRFLIKIGYNVNELV